MKALNISLFLMSLSFTSCQEVEFTVSAHHIEELHWVKYKQSSMPIIIAGNGTSDLIIIRIHGGPGASSIQEYQASDWVEAFENEYLMAYWDQPFSGFSINDNFPEIEHFDISHYRQSLEVVIEFIDSIMPGKKIVLWGQSWGGLIVSDFITEPGLQSKYAGWINESGINTNGFRDYMGLRASIIEEARLRLSQGESKWIQELEWMDQNPYDPSFKDLDKWIKYENYADELLGPLDPESVPINFKRRNNFFREAIHRQRGAYNAYHPFNSDLFSSDKFYFFNKDSMISNISKNGLFIQGKSDRSVSLKSSLEFVRLSAPFSTMLIYESSGHNPSITERDRFIDDVGSYLKGL